MTDIPPQLLRETLDAFFRAIESLDARRIAACFAEDGEIEDPVGSQVILGRAAIEASFAGGLVKLVRSAAVRTVFAQVAGDRIAAHWAMRAVATDGRTCGAEGIDVVFVNGRGEIRRVEGYWDAEAFVSCLRYPG